MSKGRGKIEPQDGEATRFTSKNQPANRGRKPSFKKQYAKLLDESGGTIWVDARLVLKRTVNKLGKNGEIEAIEQMGFQLSKMETLLARLSKLASGKNDRVALDAIKFLWEQFDGKATQPLANDPENPLINPVQVLDDLTGNKKEG